MCNPCHDRAYLIYFLRVVSSMEKRVIKTESELMVKVKRLTLLSLLVLLFFPPNRLSAVDVIEQWVARYNGPGNYDDYANAMTVDDSGNVYVTGNSFGNSSHHDYATTKYNADGIEQWVARYNGPGNYHDTPMAVAVDALGYVYVTGYSYGSGTNYDFATIKYSPNGIEQWVSRYNGPGNGNDLVYAMAVDSFGHVYVTGESLDESSRLDYKTIKYDSNGRQLWVATYNGPGNYNDSARAITLDAFGNVYVTGNSYGGAVTRENCTTVKYNSSGHELWVAIYTGPSGPPYSRYDTGTAVAVDNLGHVYVTGYSDGGDTSHDYITIKYDSYGNELWEARYNGSGNEYDHANAIALDSSGNVYVTGYSDNGITKQDYATVKYDSSGNQLWAATYNGPAYKDDRASSILVDSSDNVYVTGYSYDWGTSLDYATVMYDLAGNELWVATYDGPASAGDVETDVPDDGILSTTDGQDDDCDKAYALTMDKSGNIYVTGGSFGVDSRYDFATIKYSVEDTPPGTQVQVTELKAGAMLMFDTVEGGGNTTVTIKPDGPSIPKDMSLVPSGMVYEVTTTAVYSGMVWIAIGYDDSGLSEIQENALDLRCYEPATGQWQDITVGRDLDNNVIYGQSAHLSFFAVTVTP